MTRNEIAALLGYAEIFIQRIFLYASKYDDSISRNIKQKSQTSTVSKSVNYSLEEVLYVFEKWNENPEYVRRAFTPMMIQYLTENFDAHNNAAYVEKQKKGLTSSSAKNFIYFFNSSGGYYKVCASCSYLSARCPNKAGCKPSPFCTLYERFINKLPNKINIYKDRCPSFTLTQKSPIIFTKAGVQFLDNSDVGTTLGISNSEFTSKKTKIGEEPVLLAKVCYQH